MEKLITNIHSEIINGKGDIYGIYNNRKVRYSPVSVQDNNSNESWVYVDTGERLEGSFRYWKELKNKFKW